MPPVAIEKTISDILTAAAKRKASYVHLTVGVYPVLRIDDALVELKEEPAVSAEFMEAFAGKLLTDEQRRELAAEKEITCLRDLNGKFRFKVTIFHQKGSLAATLKLIPARIPPLGSLGLPPVVSELTKKMNGLVVIAGPYGSGRTTTVAALLEEINKSRSETIVTIEQPIEYIFSNQKSLVEQREIGRDANSFAEALQHLQEADVDVLMIDVNREPGVVPAVVQFAGAGRLAFLQMDTTTAVQTIEELLAAFSRDERDRAQLLLSKTLSAIVCQRLVPRIGGGVVVAAEVLIANDAIRTLIAGGRTRQLMTILQSSREEGMSTIDQSLGSLVKSNVVLIDRAIEYATDPIALRAAVKR
ncbi:MAG: hypothetical protein A3J59_00910 [Candidatus Buchananbacteria bacterium RIFCSPHIGHO2_02_FULL_56_16]|uniref:Bacterial type II secretion system protein E domain-containing protein n=1 Tax=Candidatus Buchananbacteria bacterium RIFCSPHIGHO2_02_FULL_56_16 TaxID=1797542 RepID=A0A1G1YCL7_9BACT|nr:MAG: hypothetical protein A3J59_00910 [Candidatus Buchananbacteria bacterium RIFCSPHIGHO2_02_FULL_56_16]